MVYCSSNSYSFCWYYQPVHKTWYFSFEMQVYIALSTFLLLVCFLVAETQSWTEFWNLIISLKKKVKLKFKFKNYFFHAFGVKKPWKKWHLEVKSCSNYCNCFLIFMTLVWYVQSKIQDATWYVFTLAVFCPHLSTNIIDL